jgi:enoyl-CoA hydratase/carnithine racemase
VDAVAAKGGALAAAQEKARALAAEAPLPIAYMKQWFSDDMEAALAREADFQAALFATADHEEGREAFLAKRKPVFHGR